MKGLMNSMFSPKRRGRTVSLLIVILAYVILQAMIMSGNLSRLLISLLVPVCAYIVAALGLNLNVGFSGELNLGQAGFMSIGAFTSVILAGILNANGITGIPVLILCILAGAAMAAAVGWLISVPVLKLQGDYLAIVTLAFGQIIMSLINNLYCGIDSKGLHFAFVTNTIELAEGGKMLISGPMGATGVSTVSTFTAGFILVVLTLLIVYNLIDSRSGRAITAARDNRIAAESIGISISRTKTLAFVISSCLGGAAGALYALNYSSFVATKFDFNSSILLLVYVVLGGLGNMSGTIISTAVLVVLPEMLRFLQNYRMLIYAVVLIVIMLVSNNEFLKTKAEQLKKKLSANRKKGASENV